MFEFIEADDIRVGDEVVGSSNGFATRFRVARIDNGRLYAEQPGGSHSLSAFLWAHECKWSLLDRPTPAVDLPTEPTLGWLTSKYGGSVLGAWERYESSVRSHVGEASALVRERALPLQDVAEFVEAVAVPKAALDELRDYLLDSGLDLTGAVEGFLAAVDAANGATS